MVLHHGNQPAMIVHASTCACIWAMTGDRYVNNVLPCNAMTREDIANIFLFSCCPTISNIKVTLIRILKKKLYKLPFPLMDHVAQNVP